MRRRILSALGRLGIESVSVLQHRILRERTLFTALLTQLTVPVSDLFRDPAYFRALREHVLPVLATYPSLKVWVAGCSTGEEVLCWPSSWMRRSSSSGPSCTPRT